MRPPTARYFINLALFSLIAVTVGSLFLALGLSYRAAATYTQPPRQPVLSTPARYGLAWEEAPLLTEDGLELAAWYMASQNRAALILVHGIGTNRADLLPLARDLAEQGFALLLLDLRAHGDSGGQTSTLGVHEVRDVRSAVRYLQDRPEVDPDRLGIYGNSLGASVAIMAAAEVPALKAVVADSGFASVEWVAGNQFDALVRVPFWMAPLVLTMGRWQTGVDPGEIAPVRRIHRISPRPVLIVHGERDQTFLVENARLLAAAAGEPKELWIVPEAVHGAAYGLHPEVYVQRVASFFRRALLPPDCPEGGRSC